MNKKLLIKNIALVLIGAMFFVGDRLLKAFFGGPAYSGPMKVLGDFFSLSFTPNYYIAFSLPVAGLWLNIAITIIIAAIAFWVIYLILAKNSNKADIFPLTYLIFGAISNLLDRWRLGYVIDYFDLKYFTVFNLADIMITGSVVWMVLGILKKKQP